MVLITHNSSAGHLVLPPKQPSQSLPLVSHEWHLNSQSQAELVTNQNSETV
jgi:hypothetical protein